jgi:hypothetical protein
MHGHRIPKGGHSATLSSGSARTDRGTAMSVTMTCDLCGEPIEDGFFAKLDVEGVVPDDGALGWQRLHTYYGHYHSARRGDDGHSCFWRMEEAIFLAQDAGGSLERIPTISGQAVAARRRKHRRDES